MDDALFQEWSEALAALRKKRSDELHQQQQQKVDFSPAEFFDIAGQSLDEILDRWLAFEARSADKKAVNVDQLRTELDGIFDFEVDAVSRDMDTVRGGARWDQGDVDQALEKFESVTQELKKKYVLKTSGLGATAKKRMIDDTPAPAPEVRARHGGGSGTGSGVSVITMFVVGLVLGAGPSVYFWDQSKNADKANQDERAKILAEQRALEDSMTLLHERFDQLATGKIQSIPEIDREIEKIRRAVGERRKEAEAEYNRERERLMKRTPAGDRLDEALTRVAEARNQRLAQLASQEAQSVEPLEKQKNTLQELRVR